jgi:hypothetical protein
MRRESLRRACGERGTPHPSAFGCHLLPLEKAHHVEISALNRSHNRGKIHILFVHRLAATSAFSSGRRGTAIAVDEVFYIGHSVECMRKDFIFKNYNFLFDRKQNCNHSTPHPPRKLGTF